MQAGMVLVLARADHMKVDLDAGSLDFEQNENRVLEVKEI
jgi:hypothetical protein